MAANSDPVSLDPNPSSEDSNSSSDHPADGTTISTVTTYGTVRGKWLDGVARFAGMPFAAPPVGDLRFRPPAPADAWEGERDATAFGPVSPQNPSMMDLLFGGESESWDEDCLYLNVWTPGLDDEGAGSADGADGRPVMVWIHGGGFEMGSGSSPLYRGDSFARDGVVFVSVNYRLGSIGFLELGHLDPADAGSGNAGLLDQIAALEWVRDNIAAFGGDPSRVTVFGESAGAMSVSLLLASPRAENLFAQAITQSGAASAARTPAGAEADADEFMTNAGLSTVEDLRAAPIEVLLKAHADMAGTRMSNPGDVFETHGNPLAFLAFRPVADGKVVPTSAIDAISAGSAPGVNLLTGTNLEEWKLFSLATAPVTDEAGLLKRMGALVDDPQAALAAYRNEFPDGSLPDIECAFMTDLIFRVPSDRLAAAQARHAEVYQYRFDWKSEAMGGILGAAHAVEIPFVFDLVNDNRLHVLLGPAAPAELAAQVHDSWVSFATSGSPGQSSSSDWLASSAGSRVVQVFGTPSAVVKEPMPTVSAFWETTQG